MHPLWFYKHQHDNRVRSKLYVACQRWWFQWRLWFVPSVPSGEIHNYCTPHIIKESFENFLNHRCNYILLSQVYCVWQFVKTPTIICNNPVLYKTHTFFSYITIRSCLALISSPKYIVFGCIHLLVSLCLISLLQFAVIWKVFHIFKNPLFFFVQFSWC
jgi:hypothetical protein